MSPTEDELRTALRHGQGDGLDAGRVLQRAQAYRRERRTRWLASAAAVVVVTGIGTGIGIATTRGDTAPRNSAGSADGTGVGRAAPGAGPSTNPRLASPQQGCPTQSPGYAADGHAPANVPFFTARVIAVTVCAYREGDERLIRTGDQQLSQTLTGSDAVAVVDSITRAGRQRPSGTVNCQVVVANSVGTLVVLARYEDGRAAAPVVIGVQPCQFGTVTNGSATAYGWQLPPALTGLLAKAQQAVR